MNSTQLFWKDKLIYKQYLGIYVNESGHVQCAGCYRWLPGLLPAGRGILKNQIYPHDTLKKMLDQVAPAGRRRIYLALPRSLFFTRRIELPHLPLDDVSDSVVNRLETHSHLPLEEIYYDILFTETADKKVNALLIYTPRKKLDVYLNQFRETGHLGSLDGIFPFSYGAGPWQNHSKQTALLIRYQGAEELAIYHNASCVDSFLLDGSISGPDREQVIQDILVDHGMVPDQVLSISDSGDREKENRGFVALAPFVAGMQQIRVDENPPKIKLFRPMKVLVPVFILLAAMIAYMTVDIRTTIDVRQSDLAGIRQKIDEINREIDPILEAKEVLKQAAEYKGDVEDFVATKPPLYTYINELAQTVPPNTWFAHLSYKPGIISMQGEGDDVLKVVEALRESGKYKEVKLQGSVSTTKEGKDSFRIDLVLKEPVDVIEGREK